MSILMPPEELPRPTELPYPLFCQPKFKGTRMLLTDKGFVDPWSGTLIINKAIYNRIPSALGGIQGFVLDGIITIPKTSSKKTEELLKLENKAFPVNTRFIAFDCFSKEEWGTKKKGKPYSSRLVTLRKIINELGDFKNVIDCPTDLVSSGAEVIEYYKEYINKDYLGCILRIPDAKYSWNKVKFTDEIIYKMEVKTKK